MIETIEMVRNVGFPIFVAIVLLYDKMKTNGSLLKVVENNSRILEKLETTICKNG